MTKMGSKMHLEQRLKQIQRFISKIPSLSTTVEKVMEICNNPAASPNDLNRVISYDPVLTGQILRLINSAYYGLPNRITSLTRAIIMLGLNTVKNLVLATSVLGSFKSRSQVPQLPMDDFWAHSLGVGVTAKMIAKREKIPAQEHEAFFVAGLLHDLGKLPLMVCFPDLYSQTIDDADSGQLPLFKIEKTNIGFDHCEVGMLIAAKWKLKSKIQNAIVGHHRVGMSEGPVDILTAYTNLANQLINGLKIVSAGDRNTEDFTFEKTSNDLGVSPQRLLELKPHIENEIEKAKVFLQVAGKG